MLEFVCQLCNSEDNRNITPAASSHQLVLAVCLHPSKDIQARYLRRSRILRTISYKLQMEVSV